MRVLMPLPSRDFDPSEAAISWSVLTGAGYPVFFATPEGEPGKADSLMLTGQGLGFLQGILKADRTALDAYERMIEAPEYMAPKRWADLKADDFEALLLPGGHAQGMREYLESQVLQKLVAEFFARDKPVGAICHGVVLAARSRGSDGQSVLKGKRTTALLRRQELLAWTLTKHFLGTYYRTYPVTVEDEVRSVLGHPAQFVAGPTPLFRDTPKANRWGFALRDGNYVSARWPGDAHTFAHSFIALLLERKS